MITQGASLTPFMAVVDCLFLAPVSVPMTVGLELNDTHRGGIEEVGLRKAVTEVESGEDMDTRETVLVPDMCRNRWVVTPGRRECD